MRAAVEEPKPQLTRHQATRAVRADDTRGNDLLLVKACRRLHATYQIRLLAHMAARNACRLILIVHRDAVLSDALRSFVRRHRRVVRVEHIESHVG